MWVSGMQTLVHALEGIEAMDGFTDFKYQATLRAQLSVALFHVLHVVNADETDVAAVSVECMIHIPCSNRARVSLYPCG